eukprot:TRINITY_DN4218_c0_g1_i2.p1 TRINITY_DN4218_c0_g1~~TRINITY_DN4218_c0_g1_i2.p1  ORF type:complete len:256 (+),score=65.52 TRINITY_DN4218_c0_g1_i2:53-769(+)
MDEFMDFKAYVAKLESMKEFRAAGIAKIVPPQEWKDKFCPDYSDSDVASSIEHISIPSPITQEAAKVGVGCYHVANIEQNAVDVGRFKAKKQELLPSVSSRKVKGDFKQGFENDEEKQKYVDQVEVSFWKTIGFSPPVYGADILGSIFELGDKQLAENNPWNVNRLDSILRLLGNAVPGVNQGYLYFGSWKALFAWHVEDMDLESINYIHFGAPKLWYGVSPDYGTKGIWRSQHQFKS